MPNDLGADWALLTRCSGSLSESFGLGGRNRSCSSPQKRWCVGIARAFRLYWSWLSRTRHAAGRKPLSREVREPIFRMVAENPTWGAPRIHGELLKLGFDVSERTVS